MEYRIEPKDHNFRVGTRVHSILYGGRNGIVYAIHGEQRPETVKSFGGGVMVMGGCADFDVVFDNGTISNRVPESIVRGVQWRVLPGIATAEEIAQALAIAAARDASEKAKATEAAEARRLYVERIKAENPDLLQGQDCVTAAKNMRKELAKEFPGVKFSVRTERYSGGNSINVGWTDGPTSAQVKAITDKYQEGDFNGMDDSYEYRRGPWTDVFGGSKYVFENRRHSAEFIAKAIDKAAEEYGAKELPSVEDFQHGRAWSTSPMENGGGSHHWDWQSIISRTMAEMVG